MEQRAPRSRDETRREERVVLVDARGRDLVGADGAIRSAEKLAAHRQGLRHRAVSVFLFDGDRVLLQKRAKGKYHSAGLWSNACCTHPRPRETPLHAARRRLREELGCACRLVPLFRRRYVADVGAGWIENEYDHVFVGESPSPLAPDPAEVAAWKWVREEQLLESLRTRPERYSAWLKLLFPEVVARRRR
jgi:isopentenyl-diphosphate delta-isomerase